MTKRIIIGIVLLVLMIPSMAIWADSQTQIYPAAILPFKARGAGLEGYGTKIGDALFATMSSFPDIYLVDRLELSSLLDEHQLNLSGMVNSQQAVQVGQLTGAKVLITGSISELDTNIIIVAKIISTETSRVLGEMVKGKTSDDLLPLIESLAGKVVQTINERSRELVPVQKTKEDVVSEVLKAIGDKPRPSIAVDIHERHIGQATIDPAAETEMIYVARATRFDVIDTSSDQSKKADVVLKGEGFSEFAGRRGELTSVKARLEVRAVNVATGEIVAIDRQTEVEVDLSEHIAGKKALQRAANTIASRMLPKLVAP